MSQRVQIYLLVGLLVVLGVSAYFAFNKAPVPGFTGVLAADTKFQPLDVQEPRLRVDELVRLRKLDVYSGAHRNIFMAAAPLPPRGAAGTPPPKPVGDPYPLVPPPPPPVQFPGEFFGYKSEPRTGKRVAFFTSGDDIVLAAEGDKLLNTFRLIHIGNDSAAVEEISSGRRATVPLVQPPNSGAGSSP